MTNGAFHSGASDDPTASRDERYTLASHAITVARGCGRSPTQGSIEIAAERDGICIAILRRAKFDIGVRSSKDGKPGAWWRTLPPPED
jgi:hypothetical protein